MPRLRELAGIQTQRDQRARQREQRGRETAYERRRNGHAHIVKGPGAGSTAAICDFAATQRKAAAAAAQTASATTARSASPITYGGIT